MNLIKNGHLKRAVSLLMVFMFMFTLLPASLVMAEVTIYEARDLGDVNGDGVIDMSDVSLIRRYFSNGDESIFSEGGIMAADVNCDDAVDIIDASAIVSNYMYGIPCEQAIYNEGHNMVLSADKTSAMRGEEIELTITLKDADLENISAVQYTVLFSDWVSPLSTNVKCFETEWYNKIKNHEEIGILGNPIVGVRHWDGAYSQAFNVGFVSTNGETFKAESFVNEDGEIVNYSDGVIVGKLIFTANDDIEDISNEFMLGNTKLSKTIDNMWCYGYEADAVNLWDAADFSVEEVIRLIDEIYMYTMDDPSFLAALEAAEMAYEALPDDEKSFVHNHEMLVQARADYDVYVDTEGDSHYHDWVMANEVIVLIDEIGDPYNDVTLDSEDAIVMAENAYANLTEEQKAMVTNYDMLYQAREIYEMLKNEAFYMPIDEVIFLIDMIGDVTLDSEESIIAAEEAYYALTDEQMDLVTNYHVLKDARNRYEALVNQSTPSAPGGGSGGGGGYTMMLTSDKVSVAAGETITLTVTFDGLMNYIYDVQYSILFDDTYVSTSVSGRTPACFDSAWYSSMKNGEGLGYIDTPSVGLNENRLNIAFMSTDGDGYCIDEYSDLYGVYTTEAGKIKFTALEDIDDISKVFTLTGTNATALVGGLLQSITVEAVQLEPTPVPVPDPDQEAADAVIALIGAIGEVNLAEGDDKISTAEQAYEALTDYQKSLVTNYADLVAAREKYSKLKDAYYKEEADRAAAQCIIDLINAIGEVTLNSLNAIENAESAYDNLTDEQKILVTNYDVLTLARAEFERLNEEAEREAADIAAADVVIELINAIGTVTVNSLNAIETAESAYDNLTVNQQAFVTNYATLTAARHAYEELTKLPVKIASGSCGTSVNWMLYDNGNLVVSGSGAMSGYSDNTSMPWYKYINDIVSVSVENGVTSVGNRTFANASNLKEITLAGTVATIGSYAFYNCDSLESVELPEGLTKINEQTFGDCSSLKNVYIPASVTAIGNNVFYSCNCLEEINVASTNTKYCSVDGILYSKTMSTLIVYPACKTDTEFEMHTSVVTLGAYAFAGNKYLENVIVSKGIKLLAYEVFKNCSNLTSIVIPVSVTSIASGAFKNTSLETIYYYGSEDAWGKISITASGNTVIDTAQKIFNYTDKEIVTSGVCGTTVNWVLYGDGTLEISGSGAIPDYTSNTAMPWYKYINNISSVLICGGITKVGSRAFANALNLKEVTLSSTVATIGSMAFYNCDFLESVLLPEGVSTISEKAFSDCSSLKNIRISGSVTTIGNNVFYLCYALEKIEVESTNTKYCSVDDVLYSKAMTTLIVYPACKTNSEFEIPESVVTLGAYAFAGNNYLEKVVVSKGIKLIAYEVFKNCSNLTSVVIPVTVTSIAGGAFKNTALKTIYYYGSESDWSNITIATGNTEVTNSQIIYNYVPVDNSCGENATWSIIDGVLTISGTGAMYDYDAEANPENPTPWFASRNSITSIVVEEGITSIGAYAFSGLTNVSKITLPETVTTYGNYAFGGCIKITSFEISANVTNIGVGCFFGDVKLSAISVNYNNPNYCSVDGVLYSRDMTEIICHPAGKMAAFGFTIPATVTKISKYAFAMCMTLPNIVIPDGVTSIGVRAFIGCAYLSTITLPESLKEIGYYAFDTCSSLNKIIFLGTDDEWYSLNIADGNECFTNVVPTFPVRSVLITDASLTLTLGGISKQLKAEIYPYYATNKNVTWRSSDEGVVIVDENGYVTPTGEGTATITVTTSENGFTDSVEVTVVIPVEHIELDKPEITLEIGQTATFYATIFPENATNKAVTWTTSDVNVAIVDEYGNVTAVGEGIATIGVASQDGRAFAAGLVTVEPLCIAKGESATIKWIIEKDGRLVISGTGDISSNTIDMGWKNYSDEITSVVIEEGITGIVGDAFINCVNLTEAELPTTLIRLGSAPFAGTGLTSITIPERVTGISYNTFDRCYNLENIYVNENNSKFRSVDGVLYDTSRNALMLYPWGKRNESLVIEDGTTTILTNSFTYNDYLREITIPVSVTNIQAAFRTCKVLSDVYYLGTSNQWAAIEIYENGNNSLFNATIHFTDVPVERIELNETEITLNKGEYRQLYATVLPEDATNQNVIWTSDNLDVAKVSVDGEVYAVGAGTAIITVTTEDGGHFAECIVTVGVPVRGIEIFEDGIKLEKGETQTLSVAVYPEDASNKTIIWTSSDENVAVVDEKGNVTAIGVGFAIITATTEEGNFFDDCDVEVRVSPTEFKLDKEMLALNVGEGYKLNTIIEPENASYQEFTWSTTDENIVKVDENGYITAIGEGTATVSVNYAYWGMTASCVVTVTDVIPDDAPVIEVSKEIATSGNEVNVTVSLKNNPGFVTMKLMLDYDKDALTLVNVEDLGVLGDNVHSDDYTSDAYVLFWDNGAAAENFTANGDIVKLTFAVKEDAQIGEYPVIVTYDIDNYDIFDIDLTPVKFIVVDGAVEVADFVYGDVNEDGKINAIDSAILARYLANWTGVTLNKNAADVNADGKVNALDSAILKRHLAGWDTYEKLPR